MKTPLFVLVWLLLMGCLAAAQTVCREAQGVAEDRQSSFTKFSISLPSKSGKIQAHAVVPNVQNKATYGIIFAVSRLVGSDPDRVADMFPVAVDLARTGQASIVLQRELTWPNIDKTVGQMQEEVLCAQQWLAAHAKVKADDWEFIGPFADVPTFEQLHAVGDDSSMVFATIYTIGGLGDNKNTEHVLRNGSIELIALSGLP